MGALVNNSVSTLRVFAILLLTAALTGCPIDVEWKLYNNSSEEISLILQHGTRPVQQGGAIRIGTNAGSISWNELGLVGDRQGKYARTLSIRRRLGTAQYCLKCVGLHAEAGMPPACELQLEPDGKLYIVERGAHSPRKPQLPQPRGFPIGSVDNVTTDCLVGGDNP